MTFGDSPGAEESMCLGRIRIILWRGTFWRRIDAQRQTELEVVQEHFPVFAERGIEGWMIGESQTSTHI